MTTILKAMKTRLAAMLPLVFAGFLLADSPLKIASLPVALSNNAVASLKTRSAFHIFSFMGIGGRKTWDSVTNAGYSYNAKSGKWSPIRSVPGTAGRIAASAIGARQQVFLFGGIVIDRQGGELAVPDVNMYEPETGRWYRGADLPVPVGDAVVGVYRDRYIYLLGGWSQAAAVKDVQVYDSETNKWAQGTPLPGTAVFGHAGGVVDDTIVYVDGARQNPAGPARYVASEECWIGQIDHKAPTHIAWVKLPNHPGNAHFRIAAGVSPREQKIYFSGGAAVPYRVDGVGYDGTPAQPSPMTFAFDRRHRKWEVVNPDTPSPTMDNRGLVVTSVGLVTVGGMDGGQQATSSVALLPTEAAGQSR
jgi:N-acetylneuraminic acid mutarotase